MRCARRTTSAYGHAERFWKGTHTRTLLRVYRNGSSFIQKAIIPGCGGLRRSSSAQERKDRTLSQSGSNNHHHVRRFHTHRDDPEARKRVRAAFKAGKQQVPCQAPNSGAPESGTHVRLGLAILRRRPVQPLSLVSTPPVRLRQLVRLSVCTEECHGEGCGRLRDATMYDARC